MDTSTTDSGKQSSVSSALAPPLSYSPFSAASLIAHVSGVAAQLGLGIPLALSIPDLARLAATTKEWKPLLIVAALLVILVIPGSIRDVRAVILGILGRNQTPK